MDTPESAWLDPDSGVLFVSQIGGDPIAKDGNGRISKLTLDGKVAATSWVTGLDAPKGLRGTRGTLWVADIDQVVGIDIASGRITQRHAAPGAKFLNDVALGPDGSVYVSDTFGSRLYRLKDGQISVFAEGEDLEYPNGLLCEGGALVVAGWGKPEADFTTKVPGRLFKLDLATKKKTLVTPQPAGNLDGLESDGRGGYVVSDWISGKVLHIAADGRIRTLRQYRQGTADLAYLPANKTLILPLMLENRVVAVDLSGEME
jgi:sugar lactone lactonase YvrE